MDPAEILIRDRSRFQSLIQLAPAGIRVKGVPCGDNFIWGPEEAVRNLYHDQSFADRILALTPSEEQLDVMLRNRFTVAKLGWQPRWFNPDLEKWLHRIKLPALVIWGRGDRIIPFSHAAAATGAKAEIIDGAGHMVQMEQAGKVNALIKAQITR